MSSQNSHNQPPAKRRMAGYTPLSDQGAETDAAATSGPEIAPEHEASTVNEAPQIPADQPSAPVATDTQPQTTPKRKPRMAGSPASVTNDEEQEDKPDRLLSAGESAQRADAEQTGQAPPVKTRTGSGGSSGVAPKNRMGADHSAEDAGKGQDSGQQSVSKPSRMAGSAGGGTTRMGGSNGRASTQDGAGSAQAAKTTQEVASSSSEQATDGTARPRWVRPVVIIGLLVVVALVVVLGARWLRTVEGVQEFIATYDGHATQPDAAPEGMPWWMGWQHFFNMFLIVLIIRTGLQVRNERKPPGHWTAKKGSFFSPKSNTPKKVSLSQWLHQFLDVFWVVNGLIFVVLLLVTGHWMRIVPTDWDLFPNMISTGLQYASLDWPTENGWVHYNALQVVTYFLTVFVAAPLAIISGLRFSTWWPDNADKLNKVYPVEWARAVHFPVMLYFVGFTIVHVFLVFFTGALRNLNHMYTSRDVVDWWGLVVFLISLVVIAAAWFLTKPLFTTPLAQRMGKVTK